MPVMGNPGAGLAAIASVAIVVGVGLFTARFMSGAQSAARSAWAAAETTPVDAATPALTVHDPVPESAVALRSAPD